MAYIQQYPEAVIAQQSVGVRLTFSCLNVKCGGATWDRVGVLAPGRSVETGPCPSCGGKQLQVTYAFLEGSG